MPDDMLEDEKGRAADRGWHIDPVFGPAGEIQIFDIYIAGAWHGSRRTLQRCFDYLRRKGLDVGTRVP